MVQTQNQFSQQQLEKNIHLSKRVINGPAQGFFLFEAKEFPATMACWGTGSGVWESV